MNQLAALYARVSSDRQKETHTIASQTTALLEYAQTHGYQVPPAWQFQDEGYSGATLARPGLEAVRDLAAQGQITAVLVHSPDRLSRKYAYQVLLAEEFARCGVQLVFLQAPSIQTPEDQLLVQFQGMIAEYERAQIAERCRRGKRHRAQQGLVNVLSHAPYGYRYVKKTETSTAYYQVVEAEAQIVRGIFDAYTREGLSLSAIARQLNERKVPTRRGATHWIQATIWGIVRNPAYQGRACFNKTAGHPAQRINRQVRQRGGAFSRRLVRHRRPRSEWIEIAVPALIAPETFALAQERLEKNKQFSPRRTVLPTLLQGLLVCQNCGYSLYRSSQARARGKGRLCYYRCGGRDKARHPQGAVCRNRPVRQEDLDQLVWQEILQLLEDPTLIQNEIDRRLEEAKNSDPQRQREEILRREQTRLQNSMDRLLTAYQEDLVPLQELRQRMPELRRQQQAVDSELQSLQMATQDHSRYLHLVQTLNQFRDRLRAQADKLDVLERQKILRLLVREVVVGADSIVIRHCIRLPQPTQPTPTPTCSPDTSCEASDGRSYLLRMWRNVATTCINTGDSVHARRSGFFELTFCRFWAWQGGVAE
jgi:site-specific DNA recombinase